MKKSLKDLIARHTLPDGSFEIDWDFERCKRVDRGEESEFYVPSGSSGISQRFGLKNEYKPNALLNIGTVQDVARAAGIDPRMLDEWEHRQIERMNKENVEFRKNMIADFQKQVDSHEAQNFSICLTIMLLAVKMTFEENPNVRAMGMKKVMNGMAKHLGKATERMTFESPREIFAEVMKVLADDPECDDIINIQFDDNRANRIIGIEEFDEPRDYMRMSKEMCFTESLKCGESMSNVINNLGFIQGARKCGIGLGAIKKIFVYMQEYINKTPRGDGNLVSEVDRVEKEFGVEFCGEEVEYLRRFNW